MVMSSSNPNSNLVFDFPDPSPRFEFDDLGLTNNTKNKKGIRGGFGNKKKKFGKNSSYYGYSNGNSRKNHREKEEEDDNDDDNSPSKRSTGTASTSSSSMSTSVNGSLDSSNFGESFYTNVSSNNDGFGFDNESPFKLKAAGQQQRGRQGGGNKNTTSATTLPHFDFSLPPPPSSSSPSSSSNHLSLPRPTFNHHSRDASVHSTASSTGYISEVSEFSFDRVTVTTNESGAAGGSSTHRSSGNDDAASWNFRIDDDDDAVLNAVGAYGGGQRDDGDASATANHRPIRSSSTFSNVSVSDDEDTDSDAVDALLKEGMESARRTKKKNVAVAAEAATATANYRESRENHAANNRSGESINDKSNRGKIEEGRARGRGSTIIAPSRNNAATKATFETKPAKSFNNNNSSNNNNMGDKSNVFLTDIRTTYAKFKTERNNRNNNNDPNDNKPSLLQSIMDDVQFLGLYFCATDTTVACGNDDDDK
mmetsp:Transcript_25226/g.45464  ORF Transcript_25226/g.45464 Transcript_25226/m.45464 type:complete len:480 (-) Transcript_25226:887-2326(-)|eukprot:CAMPEP_0196135166 /NCGR_PEP_ID=MMETSP0910-20130528/3900_1 /TAXON_ID=49265 /ORGANISM="Thalassiosira rotula, Strain GSO102" /LENGTH=479 /DNA_ID=CAMNT_0041395267 /DNA_START=143 /DNA_END=1582 /DNA_ORIENTATION=+